MQDPCPLCGDSGLTIVERPDGSRAARECQCRVERRIAKSLNKAQIPKRFSDCTLDSYDIHKDGVTPSQSYALYQANLFVENFFVKEAGSGLLFTGSVGTGKTHLAVGILKELVARYGVNGLFCDYRELLKEVQNSYNRQVQSTELEVLTPIFKAEVLVLDELGAFKTSDWVWDTVGQILNARYNDRLTTIITTNFPNLPAASSNKNMSDEQRVSTAKTLGDVINDRMFSRLQEMCVVIEIDGPDLRLADKRARGASTNKSLAPR